MTRMIRVMDLETGERYEQTWSPGSSLPDNTVRVVNTPLSEMLTSKPGVTVPEPGTLGIPTFDPSKETIQDARRKVQQDQQPGTDSPTSSPADAVGTPSSTPDRSPQSDGETLADSELEPEQILALIGAIMVILWGAA